MKNSLLIVGANFSKNRPFLNYLIRESEKSLGHIDNMFLNIENDKDLFLELESAIDISKNMLIFTSKRSYTTLTKIVATIFGDTLELKETTLIPTKSTVYEKDSFLIEPTSKKINVIALSENEPIPEILINNKPKEAILHLFGVDTESAKILIAPIVETSTIDIEIEQFLEGWCQICIKSREYGPISKFITQAKNLFGSKIVASSNLIRHTIESLYQNNKKITFAESCTGGMLANLFTKEAGCSNIFDGSVITYANHIKEVWLEVDEENLENYGAVSEAVVRNMLDGALKLSGADYALATSGIAGPTGGTHTKPVGTVFIGAKKRDGREIIERVQFYGDRIYIQEQSCWHGIKLLTLLDPEVFS